MIVKLPCIKVEKEEFLNLLTKSGRNEKEAQRILKMVQILKSYVVIGNVKVGIK